MRFGEKIHKSEEHFRTDQSRETKREREREDETQANGGWTGLISDECKMFCTLIRTLGGF